MTTFEERGKIAFEAYVASGPKRGIDIWGRLDKYSRARWEMVATAVALQTGADTRREVLRQIGALLGEPVPTRPLPRPERITQIARSVLTQLKDVMNLNLSFEEEANLVEQISEAIEK